MGKPKQQASLDGTLDTDCLAWMLPGCCLYDATAPGFHPNRRPRPGQPHQGPQVLSRFFSPKPAPAPGPSPAAADPPPTPPPPPPPNPKPSAAHPPVSTVASFSPAKRARALSVSPKSPAAKRPNPTLLLPVTPSAAGSWSRSTRRRRLGL
ncbi:classical arabinogalactan protein 5-like [Miscanthus floridulus]|uniref:classical arabinogalactan protein 5-like n=1 Tax=Miscanthus floridulus TaxID=154761 RepID=UPI00345774CD